eukprot:11995142-Alexandrium_andersonii.AAC.1
MRERMCHALIDTLDGLVLGDARASALEQARSRLLLAPPPKGFSVRTELAVRLRLWRAEEFGELLTRAEEQLR